MEVLKELVGNIVAIVMLTTFLDLILPSSVMRPYVKMAMGLFILVSLLNPVLALILQNREYEVFAWHQSDPAGDEILEQQDSERFLSANRQVFRQAYAQRLEVQMESLLKLVPEIESDVLVELEDDARTGYSGAVKSVAVTITGQDESREKEIKELLCQHFGLQSRQVRVAFPEKRR